MSDQQLYDLILWTINAARRELPGLHGGGCDVAAHIGLDLRTIEREVERRRNTARLSGTGSKEEEPVRPGVSDQEPEARSNDR